jgi:mRNA interferase MazF
MMARQYEIWIADLNPTIGTEPGKVRPVIIIQTDLLNKFHPSSVVCPITTNISSETEILRIHLNPGCCGLNDSSDIMVDQVRAIDNRRLLKKIGNLPPALVKPLQESLRIILDLE